MKKEIVERINKIKASTTSDDLKRYVCSFYELGSCPDCIGCSKTDSEVEDCKDDFLEKIKTHPIPIWDESFDTLQVEERETQDLSDIVGIGINCDSCYMSDKCPLFKRNSTCGIKWDDKKPKSPMEFMDFLIDVQFDRVKRASVFEKIDGGVPDANLSSEMDRLSSYLSSRDYMSRDKFSLNVEASSSSGGGGILSKIFGGTSAPKELPAETAEYLELPEEKTKVKIKRKL